MSLPVKNNSKCVIGYQASVLGVREEFINAMKQVLRYKDCESHRKSAAVQYPKHMAITQ